MEGSPIELQAVTRSYGSGDNVVHALRPTSLTIADRDYVAVMGPSGSGKSTLLNVLGLLVRPTAGRVVVGGQDTQTLGDSALSAIRGIMLGFVFQSFHLLPAATAQENVELPLVYGRVPLLKRRALAQEAIERVGLEHRSYAFPSELSGGERQRVAIARAVVRRPRLLLCDEPTGNLDSSSAARALELLDELNQAGMAIVLVTHDTDVADHASRLIVLKDGIAVESDRGNVR